MELKDQAVKIRQAVNLVITTLIDDRQKVSGGGQTLATILNGVEKLRQKLFSGSMADERIIDYLVYQLYVRRYAKWRFTIADIFSDVAIAKYRHQFMSETGKSGINYYIDRWLEEGEIARWKLTKMIAKPRPNKMGKFVYLASEELIKRRFYNTEMGYVLCQQSTTGYAQRSEACQDCNQSSKCMSATQRRYPELARLRKEDYEKWQKTTKTC